MKITINSFEQLLNFIEEHELSSEQIIQITEKLSPPLFYGSGDMDREKVINDLKEFCKRWGDNLPKGHERPIFFASETKNVYKKL